MNPAVAAHEQFMNASRTILPRVGGGGGGGVGVGVGIGRPSIQRYRWATRAEWMAADAAEFGGGC